MSHKDMLNQILDMHASKYDISIPNIQGSFRTIKNSLILSPIHLAVYKEITIRDSFRHIN